MKNVCLKILFGVLAILVTNCKEQVKFDALHDEMIKKSVSHYNKLYAATHTYIDSARMMPRTIRKEKVRIVGPYDWTSGFYPGSLWYLHMLTKNDVWKQRALAYSKKLDTIQYWTGNHDLGFIIECSYGNSLKNEPSVAFDSIIVQTAKSLITRYRPKAKTIQSWDANKRWQCPVIIDNMMNLELLFHATKITGDPIYSEIAITHAKTTMKNHFRDDYSSYHVLNYDLDTGAVLDRNTAQGFSDDSAWARGQAWGLYGFIVCYRETKNVAFLNQAKKIFDFISKHPNLPEDKIPYWDYDAPKTNEITPRDASAAAIAASALYEMSTLVTEKGNKYKAFADKIMISLSSPEYFAADGENKDFLIKHCVGSIPHGVEIDVPLNYADYYYLEALFRSKKLITSLK